MILHIYRDEYLKNKSRLLKEMKTLSTLDEVSVAAILRDNEPEYEELDAGFKVYRFRLPEKKISNLFSKYFSIIKREYVWCLNIYKKFKAYNVKVLHCHCVDDLSISVILKLLFKCGLVYDAHELETEQIKGFTFEKMLVKVIEWIGIKFSDSVLVTSYGIQEWYERNYGINNVYTIKNMPYRSTFQKLDKSILKEKLNLNNNEILFLFQGNLQSIRMLNELLNIFSNLPSTKHIVFMGYGELKEKIEEYSNKYKNIHYLPPVKPEEILLYSQGADVGIAMVKNTCLSYYYSLANKIFEYMMSGIPVIVCNYPDMAKEIDAFNAGWKVEPTEDALKKLITDLTIEEINDKKLNASNCLVNLGWENEEPKLLKAYEKFYN